MERVTSPSHLGLTAGRTRRESKQDRVIVTCMRIFLLHAPCLQTFDGGYKWSVRTFGNLDEEEEINYRFQKVGNLCSISHHLQRLVIHTPTTGDASSIDTPPPVFWREASTYLRSFGVQQLVGLLFVVAAATENNVSN